MHISYLDLYTILEWPCQGHPSSPVGAPRDAGTTLGSSPLRSSKSYRRHRAWPGPAQNHRC